MSKNVLKFSTAAADVDAYKPDAEKVISGKPDQTIRNYYTDPTGKFSAGIWTGEVGKMKISYTEENSAPYLLAKLNSPIQLGKKHLSKLAIALSYPLVLKGLGKQLKMPKRSMSSTKRTNSSIAKLKKRR
ncbi:cupin domain-containing protein [Curvivirga aplysinae]|nr:hypothetical protein [Curvivirga aplysinae]